jgi:hypothetical protein
MAGLTENDCWHVHAGDDVLVHLREEAVETFMTRAMRYVNLGTSELEHGIGYVWKEYTFSRNNIDFLSKEGYVNAGNAMILRKDDRVLYGGNCTMKRNNGLTKS